MKSSIYRLDSNNIRSMYSSLNTFYNSFMARPCRPVFNEQDDDEQEEPSLYYDWNLEQKTSTET